MKQNLAKVLGMEEHAQQVPAVLSEEQKLQQSQTDMEQYLEGHQQATEVALEAIGNAQEFAYVIGKNNSQDKATYELLKVAVEQLKEKTGVYAQSTALESIDRHNYKTEALQDVKEFIKKVWEAIKKAFFSMVDKVKAFFKTRFTFGKKVEVKVRTAQDDIEEFEKELKKQGEAFVRDFEAAAEKAMDKAKETLAKKSEELKKSRTVPEFEDTYSEKIKRFIGIPMKNKGKKTYTAIADLSTSIQILHSELKSTYADYTLEPPYMDKSGRATPPSQWRDLKDEVRWKNKFNTGVYSCTLSIKDKKVLLELNDDGQDEFYLGYTSTSHSKEYILPISKELIELANESDKAIMGYLDKISKDVNKYDSVTESKKGADDYEFAKEQLDEYKRYFSSYQQYIQSCVAAIGNLSKFTLQVADAVVEYVNETIEISKTITSKMIKVNGQVEMVD